MTAPCHKRRNRAVSFSVLFATASWLLILADLWLLKSSLQSQDVHQRAKNGRTSTSCRISYRHPKVYCPSFRMVLVPDAPAPDRWWGMHQGWYPAEEILSNILVPKFVFSVLRSSRPYTDIFIALDVLAPWSRFCRREIRPFVPEKL